MTEVLQLSGGQSHFRTSSNLRRSPPSSSSLFRDSIPLAANPRTSPALSLDPTDSPATASPSSSSASPDRRTHDSSSGLSPRSTPASSTVSLDIRAHKSDDEHDEYDHDADDDSSSNGSSSSSGGGDLDLPHYDALRFDSRGDDYGTPPPSPSRGNGLVDETNESVTDDGTVSDTPLHTPTVVDDTAITQEPSRQVDFLSYEWREEDIWSSWRNIVSQRKTVYGERSRLENASWRTWAKSKYSLRTVAPEKLNWLKESDVTWLYGPLKPAASYPITQDVSEPPSRLSKNNSFINKKPILKKRSMSEVMLQKSLSTSSLVKQAAASVQAQGRRSRKNSCHSDVVDSRLLSAIPSRDHFDYFTSHSHSSGSDGTPCENQEKKHIRFDECVEQCIAIDCKDAAADDDEDGSESDSEAVDSQGSDTSSDDGLLMKRKKRPASGPDGRGSNKSSRSNSFSGRRIIETLPSTTLKYRTDSPDVTTEAQHHTFGRSWSAARLGSSASQETLRPSNPSTNFLLPDDDETDADLDSAWSFGAGNPKSSLGACAGTGARRDATPAGRARSGTGMHREHEYEIEGMRRTESGMFMPYDEDEDEALATGLFGRVSEAINTARDIGHVLWNVGWRK